MHRPAPGLTALIISAAFLFNAAGLSAAEKEFEPGKGRWLIKTSFADQAAEKTVALSDLLKLAEPPDVAKDDSRYQSNRIPSFANTLDLKEGDIVTTTGWLHLVAGESDGDCHIQVSDSNTSRDHCTIIAS